MYYNIMFCGFIWSPIFNSHEEILEYINEKYIIHQYFVYDFANNKKEYENAILNIYTTDDISQDKVKNVKIKNMEPYPLKFVYFLFDLPDPKYRIKTGFNTQISTKVEELKKDLRNKYKVRVNKYIHDIIIHISDNEKQSNQISEIMTQYTPFQVHEFMNLKIFIKYQFNGDCFTRVDMLVRKYAIEQYANDKNYDFGIYSKMQTLRGANNFHSADFFKKLIDSVLNDGFDNNCPIEYENKYMLRNGSHRLALAYFTKKTFISCSPLINYRSEGHTHCNYAYKWFASRFNSEQLNTIHNEIFQLSKYLL